MRSIELPYRDYELSTQNIEEIHGIVDHVGFEAVISYVAIVARMSYGERDLSELLFKLAESNPVRTATNRLLERAMRDCHMYLFAPLHSSRVDPNRKSRARKKARIKRPRQ